MLRPGPEQHAVGDKVLSPKVNSLHIQIAVSVGCPAPGIVREGDPDIVRSGAYAGEGEGLHVPFAMQGRDLSRIVPVFLRNTHASAEASCRT